MPGGLRAALLDVDGILVNTERLYFQSVAESLRPYGVEIGKKEYIERWMIKQTGTPGVVRDYGLAERLGRPHDDIVGEARRAKDALLDVLISERLETVPGAMELLDVLSAYPIGLVSSSTAAEIRRSLGRFSIMERVSFVVSGDEVRETKACSSEPYERGITLHRMKAPDLKPCEVLVVEDNPVGVRSAKGAGCVVVGVPFDFTAEMDFVGADAVVPSLHEIDEGLLAGLFPDGL